MTLQHQTLTIELTAGEFWPVPLDQAYAVIKPETPGFIVLASIGAADQPPPVTTPQVFVCPAVLKIASLAPDRRAWLRASKGSGVVRIDLTARGAAPRPTFGPSPFPAI